MYAGGGNARTILCLVSVWWLCWVAGKVTDYEEERAASFPLLSLVTESLQDPQTAQGERSGDRKSLQVREDTGICFESQCRFATVNVMASELRRIWKEQFWDDPQTLQAAKSLALIAGLHQASRYLKHRRKAPGVAGTMGILPTHMLVAAQRSSFKRPDPRRRSGAKPVVLSSHGWSDAEKAKLLPNYSRSHRGHQPDRVMATPVVQQDFRLRKQPTVGSWVPPGRMTPEQRRIEKKLQSEITAFRKRKGYRILNDGPSSFTPTQREKAIYAEEKRIAGGSGKAKTQLENLIPGKKTTIPKKIAKFWTPKRIVGTLTIAALIGGLHARQKRMQRHVRQFRGEVATQAGVTPHQQWITR